MRGKLEEEGHKWDRKKGRRVMNRSEGTGKTTVGLVFIPLLYLRPETDILRLNLLFSPCRGVQNVHIYKTVIALLVGACTVQFSWWGGHQNGCYKFIPTETEAASSGQWIVEWEMFLVGSEKSLRSEETSSHQV